jgi:hypothetical protein
MFRAHASVGEVFKHTSVGIELRVVEVAKNVLD